MSDPASDPERLLADARWVRALARRLVGDADLAEDVAQETTLAAWRDGGLRPRAWIAAVTRNLARRARRDQARRARLELASARETSSDGADVAVERLEQHVRLVRAVLALDEPLRTALVERYLDGRTPRAIAERHGISPEAARQRLARGLAALRARLDREHGGDRGTWCAALALLDRGRAGAIAPCTLGASIMGTKSIVAAGALLAALGGWWWSARSEEAPAARAVVAGREARVVPSAPVPATPDDARARASAGTAGARDASESAPSATAIDRERDLHGRVVDPRGTPVVGAAIEVHANPARGYAIVDPDYAHVDELVARAATDARGEFAIALPPGVAFDLVAHAPPWARATRTGCYAGERVEIELAAGATLRGRVLDATTRAPVAGARVVLERDGFDGGPVSECASDADGAYRFDALEPGVARVDASSEGRSATFGPSVELRAGAETVQDLIAERTVVVRGRVIDGASGAPIAGAWLATTWDRMSAARTGPDGRYELRACVERYPDVTCGARGYGRACRRIAVGAGEATLDFELVPARRARGRVVDARGAAIEGAYVAAVGSARADAAARAHEWVSTRSGADGAFEFDELSPELRHVLFLKHDGFGTATFDFPAREADELVLDLGAIVLEPGELVRALVVDERGVPQRDVEIELRGTNADRARFAGDERPVGTRDVDERVARSDDLGRIAFADVAPGDYALAPRTQGDDPSTSVELRVRRGGGADVARIVVRRANAVRGRVVDDAGEPVPDVLVAIDTSHVRPTDALGRFEFLDLDDAPHSIQAYPMGLDRTDDERSFLPLAPSPLAPGAKDVELVLQRAAWIRGEVRDGEGSALAHAHVWAATPEGEIATLARADASGRFELRVARGAVLDVCVRRAGEARELFLPGVSKGAPDVIERSVAAGTRDLAITVGAPR